MIFNGLLDQNRRLHNVTLKPPVIRIGVMQKHYLTRYGEDFTSRFSKIITNPCTVWDRLPKRNTPSVSGYKEIIDLHHDSDWEVQLFGKLNFTGRACTFTPGILTAAVPPSTLVLQNANQSDREFNVTIQDILTRTHYDSEVSFKYLRKAYKLPADFAILYEEKKYAFKNRQVIQYIHHEYDFIINRCTINSFFSRIKIDNDIYEFPGWIEQVKNGRLTCLITEKIPDAVFDQLWKTADKFGCQLTLIIFSNELAPTECQIVNRKADENGNDIMDVTSPATLQDIKNWQGSTFIKSSDADFTLDSIKSKLHNAQTCYVTADTQFSELFELRSIEKPAVMNNGTPELPNYRYRQGLVATWLEQKTPIILYGKFSQKLLKECETLFAPQPYLFLNGEKKHLTHPFVLIQENPEKCLIATSFNHAESANESYHWSLLYETNFLCTHKLQLAYQQLKSAVPSIIFTYIQLKNMVNDLAIGRHYTNPFKPYLLLAKMTSPAYLQANKKFIVKKAVEQEVPKIVDNKYRLRKLKAHFEKGYPYINIVGESGIGKTTTIMDELVPFYKKQGIDAVLYCGLQMEEAAHEDKSDRLKFIYLTEADLMAPYHINSKESLFNSIPSVTVNEKLFIDPKVKYIFDGNGSDFEGRIVQEYFLRHGCVTGWKRSASEEASASLSAKFFEALDIVGITDEYSKKKYQRYVLDEMETRKKNNIPSNHSRATDDRNWEMVLIRVIYSLYCEGPVAVGKTELILAWLKKHYPNEFVYITPGEKEEMEKQLNEVKEQQKIAVVEEINTYSGGWLEEMVNPLLSRAAGSYMLFSQNPVDVPDRKLLSRALLNRMQKVECPAYTQEELVQILVYYETEKAIATQLTADFAEYNEYCEQHHLPKKTIRQLIDKAKEYSLAHGHKRKRTEGGF